MATDARWPCLSARADGSVLLLAVQPGARRTGAEGLHDGALKLRLVALPVEGQANDALVAWLADQLGLPKRAVRVVRGTASRRKAVEVDAPAETVARWLDGLLA